MENIYKHTLQELVAQQRAPSVTLYAPMYKTASPPHMCEDRTRFKNLVRQAIDELRKGPHDPAGVDTQLSDQLETVHEDVNFWETQTPGLLLCASPGSTRLFHLPVSTEEYVAVDDTYHLAPVLDLVYNDQPFYVLALAQHNPRLLLGDMYGLQPSGIELPANIRQALGLDEANPSGENQGSAVGLSSHAGWFNGRGGVSNQSEADRFRYWRMIDKKLSESADRSRPLLLAGIDAEVAEYRNLSKYPHILSAAVAGNYTEARLADIFRKAYPVVWQELIVPKHQAALDAYHELHGANPEKVAEDHASLMVAAEQGRGHYVRLATNSFTTDALGDKVEVVDRITFPEGSTNTVLNRLAMQVWKMRGKVIGLSSAEMPRGRQIVATLRY